MAKTSSPMKLSPFWMVDPIVERQLLEWMSSDDKEQDHDSSVAATGGQRNRSGTAGINGAVAVIPITGFLCRDEETAYWMEGTCTENVLDACKDLEQNQSVQSVMLLIDSPGGEANGTQEVWDAIHSLSKSKHVSAQVRGTCASAAYYIASAADDIFAGSLDQIGSIGVRFCLYDMSSYFKDKGIEAVPFDTGPYKSLGVPGTRITNDQRTYCQGIVDTYFDAFLKAVSTGRKMGIDQLKAHADGRCFFGQEAMGRGLINGIQGYETTLTELMAKASRPKRSAAVMQNTDTGKEPEMADSTVSTTPAAGNANNVQPQAATLAELKAEFPEAGSDFYVSCLEKGMTIHQAMKASNEQLKAKLEAANKRTNVVTTVGTANQTLGVAEKTVEGSAIEEWSRLVKEYLTAGKSYHEACVAAYGANPGLGDRYVQEFNARNSDVIAKNVAQQVSA